MRITSRWTPFALAALLPLVACGGADDAETEPTDEPMMEEPAEAPAEAGMMEPITVMMSAKGESGITGEATAMHHADSVAVEVAISGASADGEYPAHVHAGTCDEPGSVLAPLNSLQVTGGSGSSTTELVSSEVPRDQGAVIQVHLPDGTPAACGDMMGHGEMEGHSMDDMEGGEMGSGEAMEGGGGA